MALLVLEILSIRRMVGGVDEKASHIRYLRAVGIFSVAVGSFLLFNAAFGKGSTLKNYLRQRLSRRMRDAERHTLHSQLLCNFRRLTRYCQRGTSARLSHYFQIHPSHSAPPASS